MRFREFFTDSQGVAQIAHLLAFGAFLVGAGVVAISVYFLFWQQHSEGFTAMSVGAGLIAGAGVLEGYERRIESGGSNPGK